WVGRPSQGMGELFDEYGGQAKLLLIGRIEQLLPIAVPDMETIMQFGPVVFELGLGDIDVAHGQGIRKSIEKCRGVIRADVHDRIRLRLTVVEGDLDGVEETGEGTPLLT